MEGWNVMRYPYRNINSYQWGRCYCKSFKLKPKKTTDQDFLKAHLFKNVTPQLKECFSVSFRLIHNAKTMEILNHQTCDKNAMKSFDLHISQLWEIVAHFWPCLIQINLLFIPKDMPGFYS